MFCLSFADRVVFFLLWSVALSLLFKLLSQDIHPQVPVPVTADIIVWVITSLPHKATPGAQADLLLL